ncbi:MAG: NAD(P)H-dependent oxidoreductase subunit E [Alphaproteobacteria bacterium]
MSVAGTPEVGSRHPGKGRGLATPHPKGRQVDGAALTEIRALLGTRPRRRDLLIEHLHLVQDRHGHLSTAHLVALADEMGLAMAEVYEVATFYAHFDVVREGETPPPAVTVRVCDSLACALAGAERLLAELRDELDGEARVVRAPCMGRCERAPAVAIGHHALTGATTEAVRAAIANPRPPASGAVDGAKVIDYDGYRSGGGYQLLGQCLEGRRQVEDIIGVLEASDLRGLGGAGFPAGRKWRFVLAEPAPRLMALNADEGEPGTFKDRYYLERDPHRVLEGMLIAAWAVGAEEVYFYLRDEYPEIRALLEREIGRLEADHTAIPSIHLRRGAGAYICGEESAMLESIEGKRGLPRQRPPFPAQVGLFGRPTLIHNVETVYWIRELIERGPEWFTSEGRHGRKGLRTFSVSGRVKEPGVKLAPAGITARELIDEYCGGMAEGHVFKAYLPGGASGGILPASMADLPLDFGTLDEHGCFIGSAAVMVLSERDDVGWAALNLLRFFADESCGQCTPCRVGCEKAVLQMANGKWDQALLRELAGAMADASICGLGQAAPNPILSTLKYFPEEVT